MRAFLICFLFIAIIATVINAYPDVEVEGNNQELFDVNAEGVEHDDTTRQARQFGYGGYGYGYRRFGGYGGYPGYGYGGYGRFGRFGGFYG